MKKREGKMLRFILFVVVAWVIGKIVSVVIRRFTERHDPRPRADNNFSEAKSNAQMEFKDVQDADFVDLGEQRKENVPK